jgi:preprotein translocase subunit SecA
VVIEEQRQQVADLRERLLTTEDAADLLMDQCVKADDIERDVLVQAGRSIALYHLDRAWTDHLAELADVREGVHLRALGRLDPLDEFHRAAVPLFNELIPNVEQKTIETFEEAEIEDGWSPEESEMVRPSATWTYLVHENPFGSELDRLIAAVGRRLSSSR